MKNEISVRLDAIETLEDRVVLSHAPSVQAAFAAFVASYDAQPAGSKMPIDDVNTLANSLVKSLGTKSTTAVRTLITGAPAPSGVSFPSATVTPTSGSLLATLRDLGPADQTKPELIQDIAQAYMHAITTKNKPVNSSAFTTFQTTYNAQAAGAKTPIETVNVLAESLSKTLGSGSSGTIRAVITGASAPNGVDFPSATVTPTSGSLLSTLRLLGPADQVKPTLIANLVSVFRYTK